MPMNILPQSSIVVKRDFNNRNKLLELADHCLERHNDAWALWLATGDHQAFLAALAAKQDRESLLKQVCHD